MPLSRFQRASSGACSCVLVVPAGSFKHQRGSCAESGSHIQERKMPREHRPLSESTPQVWTIRFGFARNTTSSPWMLTRGSPRYHFTQSAAGSQLGRGIT
jgi:hypothetical protein